MPTVIPDPELPELRDRPSAYEAEEHLRMALYGWQEAKQRSAEVWFEVERARAAAHAKHGANSIEALAPRDPRWLAVLVEEVGEASHELTYDATGSLRAELIDVLAVASAWVDALDRDRTTPAAQQHPGVEF